MIKTRTREEWDEILKVMYPMKIEKPAKPKPLLNLMLIFMILLKS